MVDLHYLLEAARSLAPFEDLEIGEEELVFGHTILPATGTLVGFNLDPEIGDDSTPASVDDDELIRIARRVLTMTKDQLDSLLEDIAEMLEEERHDPESNAALAFDDDYSPSDDGRADLQVRSVAVLPDTVLLRIESPSRFPLLDIIAICDDMLVLETIQV